tara:strand:+ start:128 stop:523 length:396 start_codon:yes stop_codon:yes gene_type:complete
MKSKKIIEYYKFIREEDKKFKDNAAVIDDGSEALYCLLFKLLGDQRSFKDLTDIFGFPPAGELEYGAENGNYDSVIEVSNDHGLELKENGATKEIDKKIITKLESYIPHLNDRIKQGDYAKDADFLESIFN